MPDNPHLIPVKAGEMLNASWLVLCEPDGTEVYRWHSPRAFRRVARDGRLFHLAGRNPAGEIVFVAGDES